MPLPEVANVLYRPSCIVRLQIRLEDFTKDNDEEPATEAEPFEQQLKLLRAAESKQVTRVSQFRASGDTTQAQREQRKLGATRAEIAKLQSRAAPARGTAEQKGDIYSITLLTSPLSMSCELNTYRSLDTLAVTLPFRDAPLESQSIRSCLIEAYLGTVPPENFSTPERWRLPLDKSTIIFRGYVDLWDTKHDSDDAVVEVSARSLEALLMDAKVDPASSLFRIKGTEKISAYVNRVLASVPATAGRKGGDQLKAIFYRANNEAEPELSQKSLLRTLQTAKSRAAAAGAGAGQVAIIADTDQGGTDTGSVRGVGEPRLPPMMEEMRAWDLIIQACGMAGGLVPTYDPSAKIANQTGDFILIRPPQTIYETVDQGTKVQGGPPDDFNRLLPDPKTPTRLQRSEVRFMVWGSNIKSFNTSRKLGRIKVPTIEVRGYNPDAPPDKRQILVRYPPKDSKRSTRLGPKGEGRTEEIFVKYVNGVRDEEQLKQYAVALYHAMGRNELSVNLETDDMMSYFDPLHPDINAQNTNDMLKVRYGTPVRCLVARQVREATAQGAKQVVITPLSEVFERRTEELRRFLLEQQERFSPNSDPDMRQALVDEMVERIVRSINSAKREDLFYARTIKHNFSAEDGWTCSMELVNFLQVRNAPKNLSATAKKQDEKLRAPSKVKPTKGQTATSRALKSQGK